MASDTVVVLLASRVVAKLEGSNGAGVDDAPGGGDPFEAEGLERGKGEDVGPAEVFGRTCARAVSI